MQEKVLIGRSRPCTDEQGIKEWKVFRTAATLPDQMKEPEPELDQQTTPANSQRDIKDTMRDSLALFFTYRT